MSHETAANSSTVECKTIRQYKRSQTSVISAVYIFPIVTWERTYIHSDGDTDSKKYHYQYQSDEHVRMTLSKIHHQQLSTDKGSSHNIQSHILPANLKEIYVCSETTILNDKHKIVHHM